MGILDDTIGRAHGQNGPAATADARLTPPVPTQRAPAPAAPTPSGSAPERDERSELRRRRDALAEQVAEMHWDLGGLAYEMAIRDYFRLDVLVRRAAVLQERDAELAEVERLLRLEESASAGNCPHCAAPHSRGALYCWQCGATLMEQAPGAVAVGAQTGEGEVDASTAVMGALLASDPVRAPAAGQGPEDGRAYGTLQDK